jgi:hypothetical protein
MGGLARRISRWTTNCLLTVMLLVIALGFGRQVRHWWHDDTVAQRGGKGDSPIFADTKIGTVPSGSADTEVLVFGDQNWSIRRQEFTGAPGAVPAALVQFCRTAIADVPPRGDAADAVEEDVLKRLAAEKPVAEEPGKWRLFQGSEGVPIVIGTRNVWQPAARTTLAKPLYRVVIWGMAAPASTSAWTIYVFQAGGAGTGISQSMVQLPLPPGGHRLASIGAAGNSITAFSADGGLDDPIRRFYDRWFTEHGWTAAIGWRQSGTGWQARFETSAGGTAVAVDVRLSSDSKGRCTGLLMESQLESKR